MTHADMAFDALVYIGRFQPFHIGHAAMIERALSKANRVILVLGSARSARSVRNPFIAAERREMIRSALPDFADRLVFTEVRDYFNGPRWAAAVRREIASHTTPRERVGLFGHFKDASSNYLRDFPDWPLVTEDNQFGINAADLRTVWFSDNGDIAGLANRTLPVVANHMLHFAKTAAFERLKAEFDYLAEYRQSWLAAPYPPVFVTVDAVVSCCDHVLLVQRGGQPGVGCWALPGGFLDQQERVAAASLRELIEETCLDVNQTALQTSLCGQQLFDHPDRSSRGRTLTHAFHYKLDLPSLPAIRAADDASAAQWIPLAKVFDLETQMHDDHFIILDHFLKLLPT